MRTHIHQWLPRDHPRVCGEHPHMPKKRSSKEGSSPRMRGTPHILRNLCLRQGIIPAYAGNTRMSAYSRAAQRDHPRVCGEHRAQQQVELGFEGSSPRMRGTQALPYVDRTRCGIIPAYAGNTRIASFRFRKTWDHPRVCGEHKDCPYADTYWRGSSPRMRGTLASEFSRTERTGIIPAYAGNTVQVMFQQSKGRDHPRVCGEHSGLSQRPHFVEGSSPRMRGTRETFRPVGFPPGIIPAYAGNTQA